MIPLRVLVRVLAVTALAAIGVVVMGLSTGGSGSHTAPATAGTVQPPAATAQPAAWSLPPNLPADAALIGRVTVPIRTSAGWVRPVTPLGNDTWLLILHHHGRHGVALIPTSGAPKTARIDLAELDLRWTRVHVDIDLSRLRLSVLRGHRLLGSFPVAAGMASTPTPTGRFSVTDRVTFPPGSTYGRFALGLSVHQSQLLGAGTAAARSRSRHLTTGQHRPVRQPRLHPGAAAGATAAGAVVPLGAPSRFTRRYEDSDMARLIYAAIASLDGYVADEQGNFDVLAPDAEVHAFVNDLERPVGTHLYGRRMYEVMVWWETMETAGEPDVMRDFAEIWWAADKIVYSRTLEAVASERTRIERDFDPETVREMKAMTERDISIGGPELAGQALAAGLVDECHLFLAPLVVGGGTRALPDGVRLQMELLDERRFGSGVVHLHYRVASGG